MICSYLINWMDLGRAVSPDAIYQQLWQLIKMHSDETSVLILIDACWLESVGFPERKPLKLFREVKFENVSL
jgi:transcriptional regulatory protein LevR